MTPASVDFLPGAMNAEDGVDEALFQRNQTAFLNALNRVKQVTVAKRLGLSETGFSDWKLKEAPELLRYLSACGLRLVPCDVKVYDPEEVQALLTLAKRQMHQIPDAESLGRDL